MKKSSTTGRLAGANNWPDSSTRSSSVLPTSGATKSSLRNSAAPMLVGVSCCSISPCALTNRRKGHGPTAPPTWCRLISRRYPKIRRRAQIWLTVRLGCRLLASQNLEQMRPLLRNQLVLASDGLRGGALLFDHIRFLSVQRVE